MQKGFYGEISDLSLNLSAQHRFGKCPIAAVVGPLDVIGEKTRREFSALAMIVDALAAHPFAGAGFITAVAALEVLGFIAVHCFVYERNTFAISIIIDGLFHIAARNNPPTVRFSSGNFNVASTIVSYVSSLKFRSASFIL